MEISAVSNLILRACRPGTDQIHCIDQFGTFLLSNKLSEFLVNFSITRTVADGDLRILVKDLVSVPDRTVGVIGTNQSQLPDWIFPAQFCSQILRNIALSLRKLQNLRSKDELDDGETLIGSLIQRLTDVAPRSMVTRS